jgi:hypothetical protein
MEESTSSEKTKVSCILVERVYKEKSKFFFFRQSKPIPTFILEKYTL